MLFYALILNTKCKFSENVVKCKIFFVFFINKNKVFCWFWKRKQ